MKNKKTPVELLLKILNNTRIKVWDDNYEVERIKEIEKEIIIRAFEEGQKNTANGFYNKSGEQYYNNEYKKN